MWPPWELSDRKSPTIFAPRQCSDTQSPSGCSRTESPLPASLLHMGGDLGLLCGAKKCLATLAPALPSASRGGRLHGVHGMCKAAILAKARVPCGCKQMPQRDGGGNRCHVTGWYRRVPGQGWLECSFGCRESITRHTHEN